MVKRADEYVCIEGKGEWWTTRPLIRLLYLLNVCDETKGKHRKELRAFGREFSYTLAFQVLVLGLGWS